MLSKVAAVVLTAGVMIASAGTGTFKVSILQDSVIDGKQVKAGDYKLELKEGNTAVLKHGKQSIEVPAREESAPSKFENTEIQYSNTNDLQEIRIGGTNTKIVFESATGTAAPSGY